MRAIKVKYIAKLEYVNTNKANIKKVMDELRALGAVGKIVFKLCTRGCLLLCTFFNPERFGRS